MGTLEKSTVQNLLNWGILRVCILISLLEWEVIDLNWTNHILSERVNERNGHCSLFPSSPNLTKKTQFFKCIYLH